MLYTRATQRMVCYQSTKSEVEIESKHLETFIAIDKIILNQLNVITTTTKSKNQTNQGLYFVLSFHFSSNLFLLHFTQATVYNNLEIKKETWSFTTDTWRRRSTALYVPFSSSSKALPMWECQRGNEGRLQREESAGPRSGGSLGPICHGHGHGHVFCIEFFAFRNCGSG